MASIIWFHRWIYSSELKKIIFFIFMTLYWTGCFALMHPAYVVRYLTPVHPFCKNCDYNLTGNTTGRCSECGQQVADFLEILP